MKDFLKKLIERKKKELKEKEERMQKSQDIQEVRSLGETLIALRDEINDAEKQLAEIEEKEKDDNKDTDANKDNNNDDNKDDGANANEGRSANGFNPNATLNIVGQARMNARGQEVDINNNDPRATMEYRTAFMNYIQRGEINKDILQFESRADATGTSSDLGVLIPTTVIQKIITDVEKVYGQISKWNFF